MKIYGLTGGIGSGKSTASKLLAEKGAVVLDADRIAREVVAPGSPALKEIEEAFGPETILPSGELNREKVGEIVFADPEKRRRLEGMTHPRIMQRFAEKIAEAGESGAEVVILDVPLLYETGNLVGAVEKIIVVYAPREVQKARVKARDGLPDEQIEGRLDAQMDMEEKRARADFLLDNSGAPDALRRQVDELWSQL